MLVGRHLPVPNQPGQPAAPGGSGGFKRQLPGRWVNSDSKRDTAAVRFNPARTGLAVGSGVPGCQRAYTAPAPPIYSQGVFADRQHLSRFLSGGATLTANDYLGSEGKTPSGDNFQHNFSHEDQSKWISKIMKLQLHYFDRMAPHLDDSQCNIRCPCERHTS